MPPVTTQALTRTVQDFLSEAAGAVVLENGALAFDLAQSKYSISGEYNRCLLHFWSPERNSVRRVLDAEVKNGTLRLAVQKLGQARPSKLEIFRDRDRRTPSARRAARGAYELKLRRALERNFPDFRVMRLTSAVDLEKSFGPAYARGLIRRGRTAFALLGVNAQETQATVDASLTFAILWLDVCRQTQPANVLVEGLKLFVPHRCSDLVRERMANLNRGAAKWKLFELNERDDSLVEIDCADRGNVTTRLTHATNGAAAGERFAGSIAKIREILPGCEVTVLSGAEIVFRWRGLEFAKARLGCEPGTFRSTEEIVFGIGAEERIMDERNEGEFIALAHRLRETRHPYGPRQHPLWRLRPERWLESLIVGDVSVVDDRLDASCQYSQVPAFSCADRAMMDVLCRTKSGRLAVVELKADEDIHLPLQGLDYWSRVQWHHARGEFQIAGYFEGHELSSEKPLLMLVAPALHVHPATDTILRYMSPEIDWEFIGIDERWREGVKSYSANDRNEERKLDLTYPPGLPPEAIRGPRSRLGLHDVFLVYRQQFSKWFAITAPTSVIAAAILWAADQKVEAVFQSIPRGEFAYHFAEMAEAGALRYGSFFLAWFLGCFALAAIATTVGELNFDEETKWHHDSHQKARENIGPLFLIAIATFCAFLAGMGAVLFVEFEVFKAVGRARFSQFNFTFVLIGEVIIASVLSWFGMAIPVALAEGVGTVAALKKSVRLSHGREIFLFLLVVEAVAGSYAAWYATHYGLALLFPAPVKFSVWYGWFVYIVFVLASAAVQPPMFIGFSLLAFAEQPVSDKSLA